MSFVLTIAGSVVNRVTSRVILHTLDLHLDAPETLSFSQLVEPAGSGSFSAGDTVAISDGGVTYFNGYLARSTTSNVGGGEIRVSYLALGQRWHANDIFITAADGTGFMTFNLPKTDLNYVAASAGKSVGDILKAVLDQHSTQLAAIGITGYTAGDLTAMTVVPPDAVTISGRLWDACADLCCQYSPNHVIWADGAGAIHVKDSSAFTPTTLTLDSDPITLGSVTKDHSECHTAVVLRGQADIQGAYLSLEEGTLAWAQSGADQAAFTILDYYSPKGAADAGAVNSMTSSTITVQSDDPALTWAVNYWSGIGAILWAFDPTSTSITFSEQVSITACTALSAGGTSVLTVSPAFNNSGYTRYQIRGSRTTKALTWRKLNITPTYVAEHLVRNFSHSFPWSPSDGMVVQTMSPTGVVCWSGTHAKPYDEFPWPFELVLPQGATPGYIILYEPAVKVTSSAAQLATPGAAIPPDDVKVLVPYSIGALSVRSPATGYSGTAYTTDGIQRILYRDYPSWLDGRNASLMQTLADQILLSEKDTVYEGSLTYHGKAATWLTLGKALNIAHPTVTTGFESINAAVRSVSFSWPQSGASVKTTLNFSTRRKAFAGDRLYLRAGWGQNQSENRNSYFNPTGANLGAWQAEQALNQIESPESGNMVDPNDYGQGAIDKNRFKPEKNTGAKPWKVDPTVEIDQATNMRKYLKNKEAERVEAKALEGIDFHLGDLGGMKSAPDKPTTTDD